MPDLAGLKRELMEVSSRTHLGFDKADADVDRIKALAEAVEALNPTPEPARASALLRGRWKLLYSSFGLERETTLARLTFRRFPDVAVTVQDIYQEIEPDLGYYDNTVAYVGPGGRPGLNVVEGRFDLHDEKRFDVVFERTFCAPEEGSADGYAAELGFDDGEGLVRVIARTPPLHSTVTYLDDTLRLNRGSYGNLYVIERVDMPADGWFRRLAPRAAEPQPA